MDIMQDTPKVNARLFLAKNLKYLRQKKGVSQEALAKNLDITRNKIASYESRNIEPRLDLIAELAKFFKISIDDLVKTEISDENYDQLTYEFSKNTHNSFEVVINTQFKEAFDDFIETNEKFDKIISGFKAYRDIQAKEDYSIDNQQLIDVLDHLIKTNKALIFEINSSIS